MSGLLIVAKQRTGTNLLRNMLQLAAGVENLSEVMHPTTRGWPGNFYDWYETNYGHSLPLIRDLAWSNLVYGEFFQSLESRAQAFAIDVKYNSYMALAPTWYTIVDTPAFLRIAMERRYLIVHLTRRDRLAHVASQLIAEHSGLYMATTEIDRSAFEPLTIDPEIVRIMINDYDREIALFDWWLRYYDNKLDLEYEMISAGPRAERESIMREISERVGANFWGYQEPSLKRVVPDWRAYVSNADQVEAALCGLISVAK